MNKKNEKEFIPKLRFPEFRQNGKWCFVFANSIFKQVNDKNDLSGLPILAITQEYGAIPRDLIDYNVSVTEKSIQSYKMVDVGDFIISLRSFQGGIEYSTYKGICSPAYVILRNSIKINEQFYKYYFKTAPFIRDLTKNLEGLRDGKMISYKQFSEVLLPKPHLDEQKKISDFLASIDNLILEQNKKLEHLKDYKKGLMQNLFPKEDELAPKIRFPKFNNTEKWTQGELGKSALKIGSGITPKGGEKNYKSFGKPFIRSQNIGWGYLILDDVVYIDDMTHDSFSSTEIKENDVLLNITGASIGRSSLADKQIVGGNVNQHVCIIRVNVKQLHPSFLNQFILSSNGQKQIASFQAGGNREGLNFGQIRSFLIPTPPTIEEQIEIANCLNSIDTLIILQTNKIDTLKIYKNGLTQQMFVNLNEFSI